MRRTEVANETYGSETLGVRKRQMRRAGVRNTVHRGDSRSREGGVGFEKRAQRENY